MSEDFMRLDLAALKMAAEDLKSTLELISGVNVQMERMTQKDNRYWQGKAAEGFRERYEKLSKKSEYTLKELSQLYKALDASIAEYERTENSNIQNVANLSAKDIFG